MNRVPFLEQGREIWGFLKIGNPPKWMGYERMVNDA